MSKKYNLQFLISLSLLIIVGLISLYSASTVKSFENFGYTTYYITHQILYGLLFGLVGFFIFSKINYHNWQKLVPLILFFSFVFLILVRVPGFGFSSGGASRWIHFGPIFFQPSEFVKLAVIIYLSAYGINLLKNGRSFTYNLLPPIIVVGLVSLLILLQPDFGTMSIVIFISAIILFTAGMKLKHFIGLIIFGLICSLVLIKFEPYRYERLTSFLNPNTDRLGSSYQINQALLGIGAGGLWGYGYGLSRQKYNYLPEPMNDSIFAITAEELGFLRTILILVLFIYFIFQCIKIAKNAPDKFGQLLGIGFASWVGMQALINISALTGLIPLTGVPLPFFSYGSSSFVILLSSAGIIFNVSKLSK